MNSFRNHKYAFINRILTKITNHLQNCDVNIFFNETEKQINRLLLLALCVEHLNTCVSPHFLYEETIYYTTNFTTNLLHYTTNTNYQFQ